MKPASPLFHAFAVVATSGWMLLAASWLLVRGRLPGRFVLQVGRSWFRRRFRGELTGFRPEQGHCFVATIRDGVPSDADIGSALVVFEDGVPLAHPHSPHDAIRTEGRGRYSHWTSNVYLATSDNSDPRSNGRRYTVAER